MKKTVLLSLVLLTVCKIYAQDTIYSIAYTFPQPVSYFEDRDTANYFYLDTNQSNNIWQIGTPSKIIFNSAYSIPLALVTDTLNSYPNDNISTFEFVVYTDDATYISFWHKFNTDTLADGGIVEVSSDGGATWINIINSPQFTLTNFYSNSNTISSNNNQPGFTGNSSWINSIIYGYALNYFRFRFTFTSDNINTNKDGWMIDNFDFTCLGTGIQEIGFNSPIQVFPNPSNDIIQIKSDNTVQFISAKIKDIMGRILVTTDLTIIDISEFQSGLYFIEITTDTEKYVARIIKK